MRRSRDEIIIRLNGRSLRRALSAGLLAAVVIAPLWLLADNLDFEGGPPALIDG